MDAKKTFLDRPVCKTNQTRTLSGAYVGQVPYEIMACKQLASEYNGLQKNIERLQREQAKMLDALHAANKLLAEKLGLTGTAELISAKTETAEVLMALFALTRKRLDAWPWWDTPAVRQAGPLQLPPKALRLAEVFLTGSTSIEVTQQIIETRGMAGLTFNRDSWQYLCRNVERVLRQLVDALQVFEITSPHDGLTVWVTGLCSGADVTTPGINQMVALQGQAAQELYEQGGFAELDRLNQLQGEQQPSTAADPTRLVGSALDRLGMSRNDLLGSVLNPSLSRPQSHSKQMKPD